MPPLSRRRRWNMAAAGDNPTGVLAGGISLQRLHLPCICRHRAFLGQHLLPSFMPPSLPACLSHALHHHSPTKFLTHLSSLLPQRRRVHSCACMAAAWLYLLSALLLPARPAWLHFCALPPMAFMYHTKLLLSRLLLFLLTLFCGACLLLPSSVKPPSWQALWQRWKRRREGGPYCSYRRMLCHLYIHHPSPLHVLSLLPGIGMASSHAGRVTWFAGSACASFRHHHSCLLCSCPFMHVVVLCLRAFL